MCKYEKKDNIVPERGREGGSRTRPGNNNNDRNNNNNTGWPQHIADCDRTNPFGERCGKICTRPRPHMLVRTVL